MKKDKTVNDSFAIDKTQDKNFGKGDYHHPDALTADEILKADKDNGATNSALESLLKKVTVVTEEEETKKEKSKPQKSLLDKCMPYIIDEDGNDTSQNEEPLYQLETVAEILKSDSERTLKKLSEEYGIVFESANETDTEPISEPEKAPDIEEISTETVEAEDKNTDSMPVISDIDIEDSPFYNIEPQTEVTEQTLTFTPITAENSEPKIIVSPHTRPFDFTDELLKITETAPAESDEVKLEKSEFEEYSPEKEFTDIQSGRELLKGFAKAKKKGFFAMWGSILSALLTAFFMLPFMSDVILTHTRVCMIITSVFVLIAAILNFKSLSGVIKIFRPQSDSDVGVCLATLSVILYSVFGIISGEIILNMQILLLIILSINSVKSFMKTSLTLRSFKQIFNSSPKHAITLINDPAITLAMTKGSVEGDCLVAAPKAVEQTEDFMKYSTFGVFLNGRTNIITAVSLVVAILTGCLSAVFFSGAVYGFYAAAAILCITAMPSLFLIDVLPLYHASKKLNRKGAMIAGKMGAELIEQANAVVINSKDIFPSGTVTLHQMKVLSENTLDDTILRAASLTEAMQSPLAPIFKKIMGTSNIAVFPDSDTVKYEEAMGISGWVDNRLLFIGNRTLMEAHGISVPDVELDRKILRQGFFPVYVASQNKACALLIVRYDVDNTVAKELRKLTNSGVTLLVKTSDPNITEAMICDYLGLYEDTVKVMTAAGCHIYVNTVAPVKSASTPAAFKANPTALPAILNCAGRFKRSNLVLISAYIISAVFGILLFAYSSFGGSGSLLSDTTLLLYSVISTVVTYLLYITQKP